MLLRRLWAGDGITCYRADLSVIPVACITGLSYSRAVSKTISFRLEDDTAAILDERVRAAGVSRTDYLLGLIVEGVQAAPESTGGESERVRAMLARSIEADATIAGLRDEVRELRRSVRAARQVDDGPAEVTSVGAVVLSATVASSPRPGGYRRPLYEVAQADCRHPAYVRRGSKCLDCGATLGT